MPRNASGTYTLPSGNPVVSGTLIDATWANNTMADLGNEVTDSLSRSGEGAMLAPLRITDGVQATPSLAFSNEPSSGLYRAGTNEWWSVAAGVQVQQHTSTGAVTRFAAGAVGTPSVSAFNDVNTGIWFPAADTLAVSTAGVEALRVNSSGVLSLVNNPTLSGGTANGVLFLNGSKVATSGSAFVFDGTNVGIGTSSPAYNLDVNTGQIRANETSTGSGDGGLISGTVSANGNAGVLFQTNAASRWNITTLGTNGASLRIYNYALASTVATFDSSGNLGIGTTSTGFNSAGLPLVVGSGSGNTGMTIFSGAGSNGSIHFADTVTTGADSYRGIITYSHSNNSMAFYTDATVRATITSVGEFLVGTTATTSGARLDVKGVDSTSSNYCVFFENSGNALLFAIQNDGRWRSGTAAASPYNFVVGATNRDLFVDNAGEIGYVSSVRESKTNITPVSDVSWLLQLNPVTFNFRKKDAEGKYTDDPDGPIKHGLIAEEVEAVNADLCFYDDVEVGGKLRGVNYSHLITPMLKLLQEQQAMIKSLEAKVAALESK